MIENQQLPGDAPSQDEDVTFERDKEATITPLTSEETEITDQHPPGESRLPAKEDTLGTSDFPPLTELEKEPKLAEEEERISEMKRRSGMDD